ncbi:hypothetical protein [Ktedonospora formicarum]|uniref:DUF8166 domain-containing protein n=1 Tax=Ktedonospora formicarum TaxID=2778364 RepID=A0A8J3HZ31_9CHLR|nr:hypothetical protein [Ktedonospora formicarum]GHO44626.1 hypothetical protein KSX_27890 [Ktedonospora formicarum]
MIIGKIVKSDSHINYVCQVYGRHEVEAQPEPSDYTFGRLVRIRVNSGPGNEPDDLLDMALGRNQKPVTYAVGVIYDTILQNPAFGSLGPRLSNETQIELFSPDYITEKAVLIYIMILGMMEQNLDEQGKQSIPSAMHGVPPLSLELDSEIETMSDEEVRAFHFFSDPADPSNPNGLEPYLHMGYLPHIIAQRSSLLPMVTLRIIDQLERLFPQNLALLSIVKRNFAWRLKVETTG